MIVRIIFACLLLCIGVLGIVLPILQGIPFLLAGLIILSLDFPYIEKKLDKLVNTHPKIEKLYKKIRNIIKKYIH